MFQWNAIVANDTYKQSHFEQNPGKTSLTYSHLTPRFTKYMKLKFPMMPEKVVVYGLQMVVQNLTELWKERFFDRPFEDTYNEAYRVLGPMIGMEDFDRYKQLHELGYLPLEFKGIEEGSHVDINIPVLTVQNTHEDFGWLTNYVESTILQDIFKPLSVATLTRELALLRDSYFEKTVSDMSAKDFALHEFSFRGQSGYYSASAACSAYLLYTKGTDTSSAVQAAQYFYNADSTIAGSIPAFEHSTATAGIQYFKNVYKDAVELNFEVEPFLALYNEGVEDKYKLKASTVKKAFKVIKKVAKRMEGSSEEDIALGTAEAFNLARVLLQVYPTGIFAYVSDSYDYQRLVSIILPALKEIIMSRDGKLVIRPDSGDPVQIVAGTFKPEALFTSEEEAIAELRDTASDYFNAEISSEGYADEVKYLVLIKGQPACVTVTAEIGRERGGMTDNDYYVVNKVNTPEVSYFLLSDKHKGTVEVLSEIFGYTTNDKGYKVLDSHIGLVYGDGINYNRIQNMYENLSLKGFASSNICLAAGAYILAHISRDDLGFAIKASKNIINGREINVYKQPKTDSSKSSAKGFFKVVKDETGKYTLIDNVTKTEEEEGELKSFWKNGEFTRRTSWTEIQTRLF